MHVCIPEAREDEPAAVVDDRLRTVREEFSLADSGHASLFDEDGVAED